MELNAAPLLSIALVSLAILVSLFRRKLAPSSKKRRAPGPRCLPFIGSLHQLHTSEPQVALRDLAKKHGPVMYLRLGQVDAVVISSPEAAEVVPRDHSVNFASRPSILATEIMCYGNIDMAFSPYGAYWRRTLRKLCTVELFSVRKVKQFEPIRDSETLSLVRNVRDNGSGGKPVNLGRLLVSCANMITTKATFGGGCNPELQERFLSAVQVGINSSGGICIGDLFPSLWFVDIDVFTAGTETTSSSAEWIMSELIQNPEAMAKAQAEVRRTFDNKSAQDHEGHMSELRYTKMVIKEGLRLHPLVPLLLPRVCQETCHIGGFEVAAGSRVMVNVWAIGRSPKHWGNTADKFMPERFEDRVVDYNGMQYEYLPFGSGRRMCPGGSFGMAALELMVARLLYYFDWSLPAGIQPEELDMDMIVTASSRSIRSRQWNCKTWSQE